jgi:hypothetical protein
MKNKSQQNEIKNEIAIYQSESRAIELKGDWQNETVWATQAQITDLFTIDRTTITKHIKNVIKFDEVDEKSNVQKMHIPNSDNPVAFYSLDIILAVGYRVNSKKAAQFRRWATEVLKEHIFKGFTINKERIAANYKSFLKAIEDVKALLKDIIKSGERLVSNGQLLKNIIVELALKLDKDLIKKLIVFY